MGRFPWKWVLPALLVALLALGAGRGDPAAGEGSTASAPPSPRAGEAASGDPLPATDAPATPAAPAASGAPTTLAPWYLTPEAEAALRCAPGGGPPPEPVRSLDDLAIVDGSRCPEGRRSYLYLLDEREGLLLETPGDEALERPGSIELTEGRHGGERALPVSSLLEGRGEVRAIEIWPCEGDPVVLAASDVLATPRRHVVVRNRGGSLKLLDLGPGESPGLRIRNLAAIRLLR